MDWKDLVNARYSCRSYMKMAVKDETLNEILEEVRLAPSAANRQPWVIYVIRDPEKRAAFKDAYSRDWLYKAPVIMVFCVHTEQAWKREDGVTAKDIDVAIAVDHFTLAAANRGLGTCWIMAFKPEAVTKILDLPSNLEPLIISPLGYPADKAPDTKKRKPLSELVRRC